MIQLLILGLLIQVKEASPYELITIISERSYEYLVHVTNGSLYYNIQQLEKKGEIKLVRTEISANAPMRNIYSVTELGVEKFNDLMKKYSAKTDDITLSIYMTTLFLDSFDHEVFQESLKAQIESTKNKIEAIDYSLKKNSEVIPEGSRLMMLNVKNHHLLNLSFFDELITKMRDET
ncbi:PadR family transcriptional regulator (plasmid) [Enterococcus sp. 22-H-5-01]|uniref:PadR family transcriptional regulator n=1 Tax=Enterococcus sp. 22-H-5-01 TaxID=3418555 RepID=UPI003D04DBBC